MIFDQFWKLLDFGNLLATALDFFMDISMMLIVEFHDEAGEIQ